MSGWRSDSGGTIDRSQPIGFTWAGRRYRGYAGDTLASALLANGISIVGRSFKYHRPRGLIAAGLEEPNGIVQLEIGAATIPNMKATQVELYEGLIANPVNAWPSVDFDLLAINSLLKRFIPAAFYYKTFLWPAWGLFEPSIRKTAGLGIAPKSPDPDTYEHRFAHIDTLVVGSGAAGLAAAEAAAETGVGVMLVEADSELGGGLLATVDPVEGQPATVWRDAALNRLRALPNVQIMPRTMAFGFYDHGLVALCERLTDHLPMHERSGARQRLWKVRCRRAILATGAFERPIAFCGNDRPGVMLASAAQTYALRFGAMPGRRIVVATNNDSGYVAAFALQDTGAEIVAIVDTRSEAGRIPAEAESRSIRVIASSAPIAAKGRRRVKSVSIGKVTGGSAQEVLRCDTVLTAGGWNPAVHLHSQSGGSLSVDEAMQAFLPSRAAQNAINVGSAAGVRDMSAAIAGARTAARNAKHHPPKSVAVGPTREFADGDVSAQKAWIDFQNDVTVADVQLASRENFRSVEHLKRYTTLGMASDQGKTSNVSGIHVLSHLLDKPAQAIGTTKFRPPYDPVTIGSIAGRAVGQDLMPLARVSAHDAQVAAGAAMEPYGGWLRAACYKRADETEAMAIEREVRAVRNSVGLFEASPLGKIEVKGADAAEFLHRMYANAVRNMKVGRCRYALMLNEHGIVYDDGILGRIGENHFLVGTTSGHAAAIADTFDEWLQCEWRDLRVLVENVTTGWAVMNLAGPRAREVLSAVGTDIDLAATAFPHMAYREGSVGGVTSRVQRVSFSGELSYEIAVPWGYGAALWAACMRAGRKFGIAPFGVEALMAMRIEKGFLHVGSDTDGTTYPQDLGFGTMIERKPDDFVGRRSTMRPDARREDRRQLVGLEVTDNAGPFTIGSHVLPAGAAKAEGTDGWVTSSVMSPTLGRPLAIALVKRGFTRVGEEVRVWHLGAWRSGRIVEPRFYDPAGERLDG